MDIDNKTTTISRGLLFKVFLRSFFVQAVRNSERLLGFGLAYMMLPVIRRLYKDGNQRRVIMWEYLSCFNTHPYFAAPIAGILIKEEEKIAAAGKENNREKIKNLKIQVMGPMGALGDTIFWATLRPLSALLGVSFVFLFWDRNKFLALVVSLLSFFFIYNFFNLAVRFLGIFKGYQSGIQMVSIVKKINVQRFISVLTAAGVAMLGVVLVILPFSCSLFNIGEIINLGPVWNFLFIVFLFILINILLLKVTPAKIILMLILFGELMVFINAG